jgi:hypothetical protein
LTIPLIDNASSIDEAWRRLGAGGIPLFDCEEAFLVGRLWIVEGAEEVLDLEEWDGGVGGPVLRSASLLRSSGWR